MEQWTAPRIPKRELKESSFDFDSLFEDGGIPKRELKDISVKKMRNGKLRNPEKGVESYGARWDARSMVANPEKGVESDRSGHRRH